MILARSPHSAPPSAHRRRHAHRRRAAPRSRLPVSVAVLIAATGVLVVACAYTASRLGYQASPWPDRAYWLGQVLIAGPIGLRLLSRRALTANGALTLVLAFAAAEYLVKVCYSPAALANPDELQHWRSTVNLLHSGKLSTVNNLLPISPHYPGLEEVTGALISVTGLPVPAAALIVAGAAHLLFVSLLYLIFRYLSRSGRVAAITVFIYATNPDFQYFDSMYAYQTLGIAFLGLAVLGAWKVSQAEWPAARASWLAIALIAIAGTAVTHHVSSYMLIGTLFLIAVGCLVTGDRTAAIWPAFLALLAAIVVSCWVRFAAPQTVSYLGPAAHGIVGGIQRLLGGAHPGAPSVSGGPAVNRAVAAAAVLATAVLLPIGWWHIWRRYRQAPWIVAMVLGSIGWYAIVAVRLTVTDGSELAGRASTFVFVPAAYVMALAIVQLITTVLRARPATAASLAIVAGLTLMFDGLANGWPPYWERLPGAHQVAGADLSAGPQDIAAAQWTLRLLGPGNRFAADLGSYTVLGSYGDQNPVRDVAYLYLSPSLNIPRIRAQYLSYILVDRRLSQSLPASGQYFPVDPGAGRYTRPLPLAYLTKFAQVPDVNRIYDGGDIVIYDLRGAGNAP